jgi:DNA-binding GntR family transcriptional regulator
MNETKRKPIGRPKGTGTQRVYDRVRDMILHLEIAPGANLDEASLEREFGVSRTPVREALIRLASEGLITLLPNRGARVTPIDVSDLSELFESLELTQRATLRWCAKRRPAAAVAELRALADDFEQAAEARDYERMGEANQAFHRKIGEASGNKYVAQLYHSLLTVSLRVARMMFAHSQQDPDDQARYYGNVIREHEAMIAAIEAGDSEAAERLGREHVALFRSRVVAYVEHSLANEVSIAD